MTLSQTMVLEKYTDSSMSYVFYDGECAVCTSAQAKAVNMLSNNKVRVVSKSIQKVTGAPLEKNDQFMFLHNGTLYTGAEAWIEVFSNSRWPLSLARKLQKVPGAIKLSEFVYFIVSKSRKIFKKCGGCDK